MSFGEYLKELRVNLTLSQRGLADAINVSNTEISRLESGKRLKPSPHILTELARIFSVPYEEMLLQAGYYDKDDFTKDSREREDMGYSIMTPFLFGRGWSNINKCEKSQPCDVIAKNNGEVWFLKFKFFITSDGNASYNESNLQKFVHNTFGKLVFCDNAITKYSIVTNNEKAYKYLITLNPVLLKLDVSIILIDFTEMKILDELLICSNDHSIA